MRLLLIHFSLVEAAVRYLLLRLRRGSSLELRDRAQWLHEACRTILRRLGIGCEYRGTRPAQGLICSNHLSYLDIVAYAAVMPCVFVSKQEVRGWPVLGFFAQAAGTIFIDRQSRTSTEAVARQIGAVLETGVPVMLFPEGTSTDGSTVLRFHPSLLQPAAGAAADITAAALAYRVSHGRERDICWYGDAPLASHLLRTLARKGMAAEIEFFPQHESYGDRKTAAVELRERVKAMRNRMKREDEE